jgi:hypothetical protein
MSGGISVPCPIDWLLAEGGPWVRHRTRLDLLGEPEDSPEVQAARAEMLSHPQIKALVAELSGWPGYPLKRHNDASHPLHKLSLLADLGFRQDDPGIGPVIERILAHQAADGAFMVTSQIPERYGGSSEVEWTWMLCDAPSVLYALLAFGLQGHPQVQRAVGHLTGLIRTNGWPCATGPDITFRGPGRKGDPCPYANLVSLKALSQLPDMLDGEVCRTGVETLLWHWEIQKERKLYLFGIGTDFRKPKFPLIWYDILHVTEVLSRFPAARRDARFGQMLDALVEQADDQGRFTAASMYKAWEGWDFADKKTPSPTITLFAQWVMQRARQDGSTP